MYTNRRRVVSIAGWFVMLLAIFLSLPVAAATQSDPPPQPTTQQERKSTMTVGIQIVAEVQPSATYLINQDESDKPTAARTTVQDCGQTTTASEVQGGDCKRQRCYTIQGVYVCIVEH